MSDKNPVAIVQAWQEAANKQDVERLLELSDTNIEIVGPRGLGYGHQLLRDWLGRAGLSLETRQIFADDNTVVIAQHGVWRNLETGQVTGTKDLASQFRVAEGRVIQFARYDNLKEALDAAGLTLGHLQS